MIILSIKYRILEGRLVVYYFSKTGSENRDPKANFKLNSWIDGYKCFLWCNNKSVNNISKYTTI